MNETKKVLIIDDEKINIMALAHFLKPDYEITVAIDGHSGIDAAERQSPDIILLDIIMPEMDGFEVIEQLKESQKTKDIPVIFITGLSNTKDEEKGLSLGAVDFITKPFNKPIVKARIETQLKILDYIQIIEDLKKKLGEN